LKVIFFRLNIENQIYFIL